MLGLFHGVTSAGAWPGVQSMPRSVIVPRPMTFPLAAGPRAPAHPPMAKARPGWCPDVAGRYPKAKADARGNCGTRWRSVGGWIARRGRNEKDLGLQTGCTENPRECVAGLLPGGRNAIHPAPAARRTHLSPDAVV